MTWGHAKGLHIADPIIFTGLKSLTLADTQQQSLLRLALEGISVRNKSPDTYSRPTVADTSYLGLQPPHSRRRCARRLRRLASRHRDGHFIGTRAGNKNGASRAK